jgi:hypothetical protein
MQEMPCRTLQSSKAGERTAAARMCVPDQACVPEQAKSNESKFTGVSSEDMRSGGFGLQGNSLSSNAAFGSSVTGGSRYRGATSGGLGSGLGSSSSASRYDDYDEPVGRGLDKVPNLAAAPAEGRACLHAAHSCMPMTCMPAAMWTPRSVYMSSQGLAHRRLLHSLHLLAEFEKSDMPLHATHT